MDILFAGLFFIPLALYFFQNISDKLLRYFEKSLAKGTSFLVGLPISVYLIYDMSTKNNWAAQLCLIFGFFLFFMFYAAACSLLLKNAREMSKRNEL